MRYRVAGLATGSDFIRIACTSVKMATFAPMPSEMVRITVATKPGDLRNWRKASLRSYIGDGREDNGSVSDNKKPTSRKRREKWAPDFVVPTGFLSQLLSSDVLHDREA